MVATGSTGSDHFAKAGSRVHFGPTSTCSTRSPHVVVAAPVADGFEGHDVVVAVELASTRSTMAVMVTRFELPVVGVVNTATA